MISFDTSGSLAKTEKYLAAMGKGDIFSALSRFGDVGVQALSKATPKDSSHTANSWSYEVLKDKTSYSIIWSNSSMADGTPVVILLQMGHGTGTGGYVQGRDFINPAMRSIFDKIVAEAWKAVTSA